MQQWFFFCIQQNEKGKFNQLIFEQLFKINLKKDWKRLNNCFFFLPWWRQFRVLKCPSSRDDATGRERRSDSDLLQWSSRDPDSRDIRATFRRLLFIFYFKGYFCVRIRFVKILSKKKSSCDGDGPYQLTSLWSRKNRPVHPTVLKKQKASQKERKC